MRSFVASAPLTAPWQPLGPNQISSPTFGLLTGRVNAIAIDPADGTGNTVYVGTTGGGVWKSTNAAGPAAGVRFTPLTDTLSVYSANAGTAVIPSLSIGALSVGNGVVLAGTGDPNDGTDSYYGSGLLHSSDGGTTWTLIQGSQDGPTGAHLFLGLGFSGFAWSSTTSGLVVAAISDALEGDLVDAPDPTYSVQGLYYSLDSGATWKMAVIQDGSQTVQTPLASGANLGGNAATSVVWNPVRGRFYAAVRFHGYYESIDGQTWTRLPQQPGTSLSLTACPTNPGSVGSSGCPIFRGALAVQPVTGDLFTLTTDVNNLDQGLWQDVCALSGSACAGPVSFGQQLPSADLHGGTGNAGLIPQADYNMALSAVASGVGGSSPDTVLFVGTSDLYRCSLVAGCTKLRNTTNAATACPPAGVAASQHAIAALATAAMPLVYIGNDGGLWRSADGVDQEAGPCSPDDATHFQNLNGGLGSLAEVVSFAQNPTDANTLLVGAGANGSAGTAAAGSLGPWNQLSPGEGGTVAIDPANSGNWYVSTARGVSVALCPNGAACTPADVAAALTIGLPQVSYDDSVIDPPWLLDPTAPTELLVGTCRVWRGPAANQASWNRTNAISALLSGPQNSKCTVGANSMIRSLAAGGPASGAAAAQNAGSTILYAGMAGAFYGGSAGGHLFATTAGGSTNSSSPWTDLTTSPVSNSHQSFNSGGFDVSSITVDAHDATGKTVYATIMGFGVSHVYRSTNAGANWTDISSNLPNAPANSLFVDPNDANTVYLALDTGVYAATQVTMCPTTNCWSVFGTGLPNAPVVELSAAIGLSLGGSTGALRAATYGRGIWQLPLLTAASSVSQPAMTLSPTSLAFGAQSAGTISPAQTITVTNSGAAPLIVTSLVISTNFQQTNTCVLGPVAVGATCAVQVSFAPTVGTPASGLLTIYGNVPGGQATATLSGTGTPAAPVVLTPLRLSFPATTIGATSAAQNITISNTGTTPATLQTPAVSGAFRISANTCGTNLGPGSGCTVGIVFTPSVSGAASGALTVTDSAGTQTALLTGNGTVPATDLLAPLSLSFGAQVLSTASAKQQVTLTNSGDVALTLISGQITSGDFTVVNGCGNSLNAHSSCAMSVAFVPRNVGNGTGVLTVTDQYRSQTVTLSGTGLAPAGVSIAPAVPLVFPTTPVSTVSAGQTVTLTNNGGVPLTIAGVAITGDFSVLSGTNTCTASVPPQSACTLQIAFKPTVGGTRTGALTVTDNAASSPQTLSLSGTGVDFVLTASTTSATVTSGQSAVYPLLITSANGVPGTVAFACSGLPAHAACVFVPATIPLGGGAVTDTLTISTGLASASLSPGRQTVWLAWILPLGALALRPWSRKHRFHALGGLLLLCSLVTASGCGAARVVPIQTGGGGSGGSSTATAAGTYTIVVSATSAGLVRTLNLTLIVQ